MNSYKVDKMGCGGCAKAVTRAILGVEPNARIEVDLTAKVVAVAGAAGSVERIAGAIAAAGYPAEPLIAAV
ncbi:heavy-metal-associated domain-containing protein [Methylobacterium gnaphalii]|uniref:Heavy metal-associated domain-containing protein n=1 Tax=Methylobacterium gnaphalii TaxID=1010610 RepID=A0A512JFY5_9HYPH|nr:heavy-metal-associated domain-containing protein [Methylobacterium gnaphalii]GEP08864.1 heavy metal-associated domain-containing protein [Methylobacterium gnaphalii]GJD70354.1 hypothetical protein MMMDOFMJ_3300 [Methylobacterium gnaphalii]GLS47629.1 heavy metal-associated domain-containing protein [Methylobacterium gnaphalii]